MRASQLTQLHETALLDKIVELYTKGTLASQFPLHREDIEAVTDGSQNREETA